MIQAVCAKQIITVSTLISPPIGKYKFEASNILHLLLACLLPGVFQAACKIYMYMWKEIWMMVVTVMESSITSEPLTYWNNTGRHDNNLCERFQNISR